VELGEFICKIYRQQFWGMVEVGTG